MRLAPAEAVRNIRSVVADSVKYVKFFVVVFTKSSMSDYSIEKGFFQPCAFCFDSIEIKCSNQNPKGTNHGK